MSGLIRAHVRSNVVGYVAIFLFATGGIASALPGKNSVDSGDVKNETLQGADVGDDELTGAQIAEATLDQGSLPVGPRGPEGPMGATGPEGPAGERGPQGLPGTNGSPDTPQQVLDKLKQVDGTGSGLEADALDGLGASGFVQDTDTAGGDLGGTHSNLQIQSGTVGTNEVGLDSLTTDDLASGSVGTAEVCPVLGKGCLTSLDYEDGSIQSFDLAAQSSVQFVPTDSPAACTASTRGLVYYDASDNELAFCDGSGYRLVAG
jgi:hypothetical protein